METRTTEFHRLVFELTLGAGSVGDLDGVLERTLDMLAVFGGLQLTPQAAVVLFNAAGEPIQVAQVGMESPWTSPRNWQVLARIDRAQQAPSLFDAAAVAIDEVASCRGIALPLRDDARCLGFAVLFAAGDALTGNMPAFTDLARALSGLVTRSLLDEIVKVREWELEEARAEAIHRLGSASEYRDTDTGWHVMRMTNYALAVARQLGLSEEQRELLYVAAPMHDVGKIGIPDAILLKPGRLDDTEMQVMKRHAEIGETILKGSDALISAAREIAGAHHERWDGAGYPRGLRGEEIPVLARICAVADVFDALTSTRPYKEAWPVEQALEWIVEQSGSQFDPAVAAAFGRAMPEIMRIRELYRDDIIDPRQVLVLPQPQAGGSGWVEWDASLSVGIDAIDEHHRYLFDLVNDIHDVVANKRGARHLARMMKALDLYAQVHFRAEEKMMEHYGFAGTQRQKSQHQRFERRLKEFHDELHNNPLTAQHDVLEFARNWLVVHIVEEDAQLRTLVVGS